MKKSASLLFVIIVLLSCGRNDSEIRITGIKCNNLENPAGVNPEPQFSWVPASGLRGARQSAYQILISTDEVSLKSEEKCFWNSGKIISPRSYGIKAAVHFQPSVNYFWKVRAWDQDDNPSEWSSPAFFITGLFQKKDWGGAIWIGYEDIPDSLLLVPGIHGSGNNLGEVAKKRMVVPYFRKVFESEKKLKQALVFVSGLGQYELYVNGTRAGDRFMAPGWTDYDKTCYYNSYDVTDRIKKGLNAIGVIAGNGFYNINRERYRKLVISYGAPKVILELLLFYDDGTIRSVVSDESWSAAPSPVTFTSIYGGEDYDARQRQEDWSEADFNDKSWRNAIAVKPPAGNLKAEFDHPLKVMQDFDARKIIHSGDSVYVWDFGQNASGIIRLKIKGKKGQQVRLWPAELLKDSLANQKASGYPYYYTYILSGNDTEEWQPRFSYYGFRYVQVSDAVPEGVPNPEGKPVISELKMLHTRNSSPETGSFRCSNDHFTRIYTLINWAIRSNLASVATDCPHREKLGWLEQTHLMGNSIKYVYDIHNLYNKIMDDMIDAQLENGLVPDIAPEYVEFVSGFRDSPEWGSACVIVPWDLYEWYGDTAAVRKAYPMMAKYLAYLDLLAPDGILIHGLGDWYDLGPGFPGEAQLTPRSLTATSIFYYDLKLMTKMASVLGKEGDAEYYRDLAESIRRSFNGKFFNSETGVYSTGSQTAYAMPLFFGMVDDEYHSRVVENLKESIRQNNNALTAGDVGYRYLLMALEQEGLSGLVFDMNSRTDVPGYGYQLSKGATSLTESWAGLTEVSNNHMMLGHLVEWFYSGPGGIRQDQNSVAYEHIIISPEIVGDINWAETSYVSVNGEIKTSWKKEADIFNLEVTIPVNSMATIVLPQPDPQKIKESGVPLASAAGISNIRTPGEKTSVDVQSGKYNFRVEMN